MAVNPPGKGVKHTSTVAVGNSATLLLAANAARQAAIIYNTTGATLYVSESNAVSTTTGVPISNGSSLNDLVSVDAWYGVTAAGGTSCMVDEIY